MWSIFSRDPIKDFAFEVGEKVSGLEDQSIWTLHEGKRKANGESVSIFAFNTSSDSSDAVMQVASSSIKRLKTLRHPNVLTFIDSLETPKTIYIVTEPVTPLSKHLKTMKEDSTRELAISWGLHQITKGLGFLVNTVNLVHNNVCMSSIFVDRSGEWKLGGVDYMYPASGDGSNLPPFKTLPVLEKYDPPEKSAKGRSRKASKWSSDMWGLGCLIWEVFNGPLPRTSSLKVVGKISKNLVPHYCELVSANPASRPSPDSFIENCRRERSFLNNHFVDTNLFLEEIQIKDQKEQNDFFCELPKYLDNFPTDYSRHKILPQLLNAFQFGNAGSAVLPPLFKLGSLLGPEEYQSKIVPCVIKLFSSTDRATRVHLLRQLHLFVEHLQPQVINSQIFPNIATGFMDTNPAIREQSIKAMLLLAPKLNDNNLNNELMKHFARLQSQDDQGPIRTNTTVCLGKIACHLNAATRQKVISSAFARAMRDPFPAARIAGVLALAGNAQYFNMKDCAYKVLPSLSALTVDPEKNVRDHCFKTLSIYLERLKQASDDPECAAKMDADASAAATTSTSGVVAGVTGWTGWMTTGVSSITSRLYKKGGEQQETTEASEDDRPKAKSSDSEKAQSEVGSRSKEVEAVDDDDDASDYGDEKNENDGWDDLEVKIEEDKVEESHVDDQDVHDNEDTGWDDADWDDAGFDVPKKSLSKSTAKSKPSKSKMKKSDSKQMSGWESWDDGVPSKASSDTSGWGDWGNDNGFDESSSHKARDSIQPTSSYQWDDAASANPDSDDFFSSMVSKPAAKPSKKLLQSSKKPLPKKTMEKKSMEVRQQSKPNDDWDWNDDWNDPDEGLSKAELMKRQREEKKRQRQEELQKKRAARAAGGAGKLGARKLD